MIMRPHTILIAYSKYLTEYGIVNIHVFSDFTMDSNFHQIPFLDGNIFRVSRGKTFH